MSNTPENPVVRRRLNLTMDGATVELIERLAAPTPLTTVQLAALLLTDAAMQAAHTATFWEARSE